jgi:hypothetical protein
MLLIAAGLCRFFAAEHLLFAGYEFERIARVFS